MLARVLAYLLRAWYARCFEDENMEEYVDGSQSCFDTTHNLLDFSVSEAYSSSGPKTLVYETSGAESGWKRPKTVIRGLDLRSIEDTAVIEWLLTRPERKVERWFQNSERSECEPI